MNKILSPQQGIIMQHLVNGNTIKEIAIMMKLATGTVRNYINKAKKKLGATTQDQAIAQVVALGEVTVAVDCMRVTDTNPAEPPSGS